MFLLWSPLLKSREHVCRHASALLPLPEADWGPTASVCLLFSFVVYPQNSPFSLQPQPHLVWRDGNCFCFWNRRLQVLMKFNSEVCLCWQNIRSWTRIRAEIPFQNTFQPNLLIFQIYKYFLNVLFSYSSNAGLLSIATCISLI